MVLGVVSEIFRWVTSTLMKFWIPITVFVVLSGAFLWYSNLERQRRVLEDKLVKVSKSIEEAKARETGLKSEIEELKTIRAQSEVSVGKSRKKYETKHVITVSDDIPLELKRLRAEWDELYPN